MSPTLPAAFRRAAASAVTRPVTRPQIPLTVAGATSPSSLSSSSSPSSHSYSTSLSLLSSTTLSSSPAVLCSAPLSPLPSSSSPSHAVIFSPLRPETRPNPYLRQQRRHSSHSPMGTPSANPRKKVTLPTLRAMHARGEPIVMLTAHDFPSGAVADAASVDVILVGDSLAMVALGMEDTSEVLLEEMLLHCRSVSRAAKSAFTVGDLPMGSYEIAPEQAVETAIRFIKEGRMSAVKLEGGASMAPTIARIAGAGIPVLAHIGLTPQRQAALGGFRVQGKTGASALALLHDALAVQAAGAFAVVLEAVPAPVAALVSRKLAIPTIGIGAGAGCGGQVLVQTDMLANFPPGRFLPKFVKTYADVWAEASRGVQAYRDEVKAGVYPAAEHTYPMPQAEVDEFERLLQEQEEEESEGK